MIVCHCFRVSDREIRRCVREHGACSVGDVAHACEAGSGCGGCRPEIASIVESEQQLARPAFKPMLPVLQVG